MKAKVILTVIALISHSTNDLQLITGDGFTNILEVETDRG